MKINKYYQANPPTPEQQRELLDKQMRQAAQSYEKYFLDEMVKAMRATVPKSDGMIKPNFAEDLYRENLDQEYVKNWTESGGVGLSQLIYEQLKAQIEGVHGEVGARPGPKPIQEEANKFKAVAAYEKQAKSEPLDD